MICTRSVKTTRRIFLTKTLQNGNEKWQRETRNVGDFGAQNAVERHNARSLFCPFQNFVC